MNDLKAKHVVPDSVKSSLSVKVMLSVDYIWSISDFRHPEDKSMLRLQ